MSTEIDSILSGIIMLLLIIVVYKWYDGKSACDQSSMTLDCGCKNGVCRCRGMSKISVMRMDKCPGGKLCICGSPHGRCRCPHNCMCQRRVRATALESPLNREGMGVPHGVDQVVSSGPSIDPNTVIDKGYQEATKEMGLEQNVSDSHQKWCDSLTYNGISAGASACTTLEETGRSYGTADFVGLTSRKWCKARQLATPDSDARVTPSYDIKEYCNIDMNELV